MMAPDPQALAAQGKIVDAQKELQAIQYSQNAREKKAQSAINFILLPMQDKDGVVRQDPEQTPESIAARAACYNWLTAYFSSDSAFERGLIVKESDVDGAMVRA